MNWKAQTLPVLLSGLQPIVTEDKRNPVSHDQTALPRPSTQEIVRCSPLAQVKRGVYTIPTFLVHGTADELIPWQQSQRMWQELTNRGVTAHLELVPGRPHICDTSADLESPDWRAVVRGYEFLARAVQLSGVDICRVKSLPVHSQEDTSGCTTIGCTVAELRCSEL